MLDPRIYRTGLIGVALAAIIVAFSFGSQQGSLTTNLAPDAFNGGDAYSLMTRLAARYPDRRPGSAGDRALGRYVAGQLRHDGFSVSTDRFSGATVDGRRPLQTVTGTLAGLSNGTVVVVASRDALSRPATAGISSTAVLLELARVLAGETQNRSIVLASTSGSTGGAGAAELARTVPGPVDAVLVLGDLAGTDVRQPTVVPWGTEARLAPQLLRNTIATALAAQAGLSAGHTSLPGQFLHLALPLGVTDQAQFNSLGIPSVLLSFSGERPPAAHEPTSLVQITAAGRTVLESVGALSAGPRVPPPSAYLLYSGKVLPAWAVRLLVLALIAPALMVAIDGIARSRRRRHSLGAALGSVVSATAPFLLAAVFVVALRAFGAIDTATRAAVPGGALTVGTSGIVIMALGLCLVAGAFALRSRLAPGLAHPGPAAPPVVLLVLALVALALWLSNPFAAALLVPALHFWMWAVGPRRAPAAALLVSGLLLPAAALVYYAHALGLGPLATAWSSVLLVAGGGIGIGGVIAAALVLGCLATLIAAALVAAREAKPEDVPITVRGPVTYAGPGSLGGTGTGSALRR